MVGLSQFEIGDEMEPDLVLTLFSWPVFVWINTENKIELMRARKRKQTENPSIWSERIDGNEHRATGSYTVSAIVVIELSRAKAGVVNE